jgi:uncharacterized protein YdaU (DUF1376 family)
VNYYRRYCGDYAADTQDLSLAEHGAYTLMLDTYYSSERPLPSSYELLYRICRAMTPAERKAVRVVADKHFPVDGEYRRNTRADKELGIAQPKIEAAKANGKKGGRPPKDETQKKPTGLLQQTQSVQKTEPVTEPVRNHPPSSSLYPEPKPSSEKRFPGGDTTPDPATSPAAAPAEPRAEPPPVTLAEARIDEGTPAAMLAAVCTANGVTPATPFHPLVVEWAKAGITMDRLKAAIATARLRKPKPEKIPPGYLDTILMDKSKPVDSRWKKDDGEAERLCRELGIPGAKVNEDRFDWHSRIARALQNQAQRQVA